MSAYNPIVLEILKKRGITDMGDIEEFLSLKPKLTYDPFLLSGMKEGVDFVMHAVKNHEKICIYGDYDVDGITASALLYLFLSRLTSNITYFIPSRFEDGYGLSKEALARLKEEGVESVITVDCGSVSRNEVSYAIDSGLKILVTDHHEMKKNTTPDCIVINPMDEKSSYPFNGLCGCGVAFKLVQAIVRTMDMERSILNEYLDLVAIATVADVVPLVDENRTMVKYGLKELNRFNRKPLRILANKLGIDKGTIDTYKISFIIAPHMNAAGRMKDANSVVRMLVSDNNHEIEGIAEMLIKHNIERKAVQNKCMEECVKTVNEHMNDDPILLIMPESVHEGISGIVAGKIREKFNKPAIVLSRSENGDNDFMLKGSGRSIEGINLDKMLKNHSELFLKVGGHSMAAGFTITESNYPILKKALINEMNEMLMRDPELLTKKTSYDIVADEDAMNISLARELDLIAPYGKDNPEPVIKLNNVWVKNIKYMGEGNKHIKFTVGEFSCILFGYEPEQKEILDDHTEIDIYGTADINFWNDRESIQFIVKAVENRKGTMC